MGGKALVSELLLLCWLKLWELLIAVCLTGCFCGLVTVFWL